MVALRLHPLQSGLRGRGRRQLGRPANRRLARRQRRRAAPSRRAGSTAWFRFYRISDVEFSFRLRDRGGRAVAVADVPVEKHEHRLWESTEPAERDRLSKRNMYRFLDRWRGREDLLVGQ